MPADDPPLPSRAPASPMRAARRVEAAAQAVSAFGMVPYHRIAWFVKDLVARS